MKITEAHDLSVQLCTALTALRDEGGPASAIAVEATPILQRLRVTLSKLAPRDTEDLSAPIRPSPFPPQAPPEGEV